MLHSTPRAAPPGWSSSPADSGLAGRRSPPHRPPPAARRCLPARRRPAAASFPAEPHCSGPLSDLRPVDPETDATHRSRARLLVLVLTACIYRRPFWAFFFFLFLFMPSRPTHSISPCPVDTALAYVTHALTLAPLAAECLAAQIVRYFLPISCFADQLPRMHRRPPFIHGHSHSNVPSGGGGVSRAGRRPAATVRCLGAAHRPPSRSAEDWP